METPSLVSQMLISSHEIVTVSLSELEIDHPRFFSSSFDPRTGISTYRSLVTPHDLPISTVLRPNRFILKKDAIDAPSPLARDSGWISLPKAIEIEKLNISGGWVFYLAEVRMSGSDLAAKKVVIKGDFASDFVGLYINGKYALTLVPFGIGIDSAARDNALSFKVPMEWWREGSNQVLFKVEAWGAGSFLFPRSKVQSIRGIPIFFMHPSLPSLGYDGLKGLAGNFSIGGKSIDTWFIKAGLKEESNRYFDPSIPIDGRDWENFFVNQRPAVLENGESAWLLYDFNSSSLPNFKRFHAPVSVELSGENCKATVWFNGRLIGRWLSDNEWLRRGNYAKPVRNLWTWFVSVDQIPIAPGAVRNHNRLTILLEDVGDALAGKTCVMDRIEIVESKEVLTFNSRSKKAEYESRVYSREVLTFV